MRAMRTSGDSDECVGTWKSLNAADIQGLAYADVPNIIVSRYCV